MKTSSSHPQATLSKVNPRIINLTNSIPDITANYILDSEHSQLPSDIFEETLYQALNDLVDEFAQNPDQFLKPHHESAIDQIASKYLNS